MTTGNPNFDSNRRQRDLANSYNEMYSSKKDAYGDGKAEAVVLEAAKLLPKDAKVIEFGAGQGRNAIALAKLGFNIEAVDISEIGVNSINNVAKEKSLSNLKARVGNANEEINGEYDMILSTFVLHHLTPDEAESFIKKIKQHTKEGGLNVITTFTAEGDILKNHTKEFYPASGKIKELYSDWEIIKKYKEEDAVLGYGLNPNRTPRHNMIAEILARKKVT